jgi:2-polyprenylphenol 6-hydroxylase
VNVASVVDHDVIIVGAGLVGLALAAALDRIGLDVAVADRSSVVGADVDVDGDDWDNRVYAISPGSATLLRSMGAWQRIPAERITAIEVMQVHGDAGGRVNFSAYAQGERALAWIVENRALQAALAECVRVGSSINVLAPCTCESITWRHDGAELRLADGGLVSARLIVGADGLRSWTREQAGMHCDPRSYDQSALVANFRIEHPHRGRALQWFLEDRGVLAWLPLPGPRMSMVWSAPIGLAAELSSLGPDALSDAVGLAGNRAFGALAQIGALASYPLAFLKLPSITGPRLALVGDAAHGVHPLAGQGVNLGFGDVAALASALAIHAVVGDAGAPILLERYARRRAEGVLAMQVATDGLSRLFDSRRPWVRALRNRGMSIVDTLPFAKALLAQPALR